MPTCRQARQSAAGSSPTNHNPQRVLVSETNEKPVVYLGQPSYGDITQGAAAAFYCASKGKLLVNRNGRGGSLLALNFNHLWCWALNACHRGERVDYFAMIHGDIEPQPGWLDELVAELEDKRLDVL